MQKIRGILSRIGEGWNRFDGDDFAFFDPGRLVDGDLELVLVETRTGNPSRDYVPMYLFYMQPPGENKCMGQLSLRIGSTEHIEMYAGHIGYMVEPKYRGRRYAARSCRLVLPLASRHGINPVWITCNPDNGPSRRTCEIIGARLEETVPIPRNNPLYAADTQWKCRYRVDLDKLIH